MIIHGRAPAVCSYSKRLFQVCVTRFSILAPVFQRLVNAIHPINHYPADSVFCFVNTYPLDSVIQPLNNWGQNSVALAVKIR